jgi:hypothetical protein
MDLEKALKRIWRTWRVGFIIAIFVYCIVFWWGYNYEVSRQEEPEYAEEPLELFSVSMEPQLTSGVKIYTINVTNTQIYTIKELVIEFRGTRLTKPDDFFATYDDTVSVGGTVSFTNLVSEGATGIDVILEGQEVIAGRTNIDLFLENTNTTASWEGTSQDNHEEIHLTENDIRTGGFGNYEARVSHVGGFRAVQFQLTYRITYSEIITSRTSIQPIAPGEGIELDFLLNIAEVQLEDVICYVNAKVELSEDLDLDLEFEYDYAWNIIRTSQPIPQEYSEKVPWGPVDRTGTSSAVLYFLTIIGGFGVYFRTRIREVVMPKLVRKAHCFIALITLMFEFAHISIALQKAWPWFTPGLLFAYIGVVTLTAFVIYSFFDVEIIKAYGRKRWRQMHLMMTIILIVLIVLHFGLMGDHLGFLKG